jgi:hypothetical protein
MPGLLGALGLPIGREEPVAPLVPPDPMVPVSEWGLFILPGDDPLGEVWLWAKAGIAAAEIPTARTACHNIVFFILSLPFSFSL